MCICKTGRNEVCVFKTNTTLFFVAKSSPLSIWCKGLVFIQLVQIFGTAFVQVEPKKSFPHFLKADLIVRHIWTDDFCTKPITKYCCRQNIAMFSHFSERLRVLNTNGKTNSATLLFFVALHKYNFHFVSSRIWSKNIRWGIIRNIRQR